MTTAMEVPQTTTMPLSNTTSKGKLYNARKTKSVKLKAKEKVERSEPTAEEMKEQTEAAAAFKAKTEAEAKAKEAKLQAAYKKLTAEWISSVGKTVDATLRNAAVIAEAKYELNAASMFSEFAYERFAHNVCRISIRTADRYVMIDTAFGAKGALKKYAAQLPPDWTKTYQLSRFSSADNLTPAKAEKAFLKALDFVTKPTEKGKPNSFATEIDLNAFVNGLLEVQPRTKLTRPETTNGVAVEVKAGKTEDGETEYAVPDAKTGASISRAASAPLGEAPTPEQIKEEIEAAQDDLFADDGNEVLTELFATAYNTLRLRSKIKAFLHEENLTNIEVLVRQKVAA